MKRKQKNVNVLFCVNLCTFPLRKMALAEISGVNVKICFPLHLAYYVSPHLAYYVSPSPNLVHSPLRKLILSPLPTSSRWLSPAETSGKWGRCFTLPLIFRGRQIHLFWHPNGALLWRVDPNFKNSVTGSGSIAKCSNILQDIKF